jgi:phosphomannomutase
MSHTPLPRPSFLLADPVELRFGTSGLRGLVRDMSDLEVYINVRGFLAFLGAGGPKTVAVARDLRDRCPDSGIDSSPRIARAVMKAADDAGYQVVNLGTVPTPALAAFALSRKVPGIMVTGSHIPADRNGVKFYKPTGEVLKSDEAPILAAVKAARAEAYGLDAGSSPFGPDGQLEVPPATPEVEPAAAREYVARFVAPFAGASPLAGRRVVLYQHSSVARDLLQEILQALGAEVIPEGRVETFVPVDTEDVMPEDEARYQDMVTRHGADALVSTDGDGDRPLVVDEAGHFHRGDAVGIVTARFVGARFAAIPVSAYDAIDLAFEGQEVTLERTRIGSPWVIDAMSAAVGAGYAPVVGWEANGGFLTATEVLLNGAALSPLPTRDAALPIVAALVSAAQAGLRLSDLFGRLPARATRAGLLDHFAPERSQALLARVRPADPAVAEADLEGPQVILRHHDGRVAPAADPADYRAIAAVFERFFDPAHGFGRVTRINFVDGVRAWFESRDIVHLRPSGNAPQFRIYTVADSQSRADEVVEDAIREPDGTLRQMERALVSA